MASHAYLSPSGWDGWANCPGQKKFVRAINRPLIQNLTAANEGTNFHQLASECAALGLDAHHLLGHRVVFEGDVFEVTDEVVEHMQPGLDRMREFPGKMYIEQVLNISEWVPDCFGTCDVAIMSHDEIVIFDWKYGAGVPVSPVNNGQLQLYALGFWKKMGCPKVKRFRLIIEQPRIAGAGGEWTLTLDELLAFGEVARERSRAALDPDAPLVAGEKQCRFCEAAPDCPELARYNLETLSMRFEDLDDEHDFPAPLPIEMTPERRSYVVLRTPMIRAWLDMQHERTLHDALSGHPTPGLKAVAGRRPPRKWTDEDKAKILLLSYGLEHKEAFKYSLISPTEASKRLKTKPDIWAACQPLVDAGKPKPVLVGLDDEREALTPITDRFED